MYDVIIIGAGPAGAMCARTIARKGHSVLMIDGKHEVGRPVQCGEALSTYALDNVGLKKNDEWYRCDLKGVKCILPNKSYFFNTVPTMSIDRALFDKWLVDQAMQQGSELKLDQRLKQVHGGPDNWTVVTSKETLKGRIIVAADGPRSITGKLLGLRENVSYFKALQYRFSSDTGMDFNDDWLTMYWGKAYHGGYGWVFPRGGEYNIGIGGFDIDFDTLNHFCQRISVDVKKKKSATGGFIVDHASFSQRAKKGCLIVGDAAGMINPVTGGGIHAALYSGKTAGGIITQALYKESLEDIITYDRVIKESVFLHPIHQKTAQYLRCWDDDDWNFLGLAAQGMDMADLSLWKSFLIGLKNPKYFLRSRELLTIRKEMELNKQCM